MWNKPLNATNAVLLRVIAKTVNCRIMNQELRVSLHKLIETSDYKSLVHYTLPPYQDLTVLDSMYARQVLGLYQKNSSLDLGIDCEAVARTAWYNAEDRCRETNTKIRDVRSGAYLMSPRVNAILHSAQRKIASVLGSSVPRLSQLRPVFGPGATRSVQKRNACHRTKLQAVPSCSTNVVSSLPELFSTWPAYAEFHGTEHDTGEPEYVVTRVNVELSDAKLEFVPKNAKTHRAIMVEPHLNGVIQGAYGTYIRDRLLCVGIDLRDQMRNKSLARRGSLTGDLATLDLSMASDLISTEVVAMLLPVDWYMALFNCRSPYAMDGDDRVPLEKFSSMGNGFTFPLQSLIYWALCASSVDTKDLDAVSVYGDDIIIPSYAVDAVVEVFGELGFSINTEKSFWEGPFRESCGGDYYLGVNIRPFYIKETLSYKTLFGLHNFAYRMGDFDLANEVLSLIPSDICIFGPDGYGDGHLLGDWLPRHHKRDQGWGGWLFDTYKEFGKRHKKPLASDHLLPVYTIYVNPDSDTPLSKTKDGTVSLPLPGVSGYRRVSIYTLTPA